MADYVLNKRFAVQLAEMLPQPRIFILTLEPETFFPFLQVAKEVGLLGSGTWVIPESSCALKQFSGEQAADFKKAKF